MADETFEFTAKLLENVQNRRRKLDALMKGEEITDPKPTPITAPKPTPITAPKPTLKSSSTPSSTPLTSSTSSSVQSTSEKDKENSNVVVNEGAPELLSLKDKKRLFEKAIIDETEASRKAQEMCKPKRRLVDWAPVAIETVEDQPKRAKNAPASPTPMMTSALPKQSSEVFEQTSLTTRDMSLETEEDEEEEEVETVEPTIAQRTISSILSGTSQSEESEATNNKCHIVSTDTTEQHEQDDDEGVEQTSILTHSRIINDSSIEHDDETEHENALAQSCQAVDEAFDGISLPESIEEVIDHPPVVENTIDITFSALDNDFGDNMPFQRSSTKADLSSEASQEDQPPKPPRVFAYNEGSLRVPPQQEVELVNNVDEPPPMRTISFYRREQKLKKEAAMSPAHGIDSPVKFLKQNIISHDVNPQTGLKHRLEENIELLKTEIKEYNRIQNQASTALNMCLGYADPEIEASRLEAERLLLVTAERRAANMNQIQRYLAILRDPNLQQVYAENAPRATVSLTDIRIPFKTDFLVERAKGKQTSTFHFICLLMCQGVVHVSNVLSSTDNVGEDVLDFKFSGTFEDLTSDFHITLKVFCMELNKEAKKKDKGNTFKIKFGTSSLKKGTPTSSIPAVSSFQSVGHVSLRLKNMNETKSNFYRMKLDTLSTPLDGYVTMNVAMDVEHRLCAEGFFDIQQESTSFWNLRYFKLADKELKFWRFKEDMKDQPPTEVIQLKHCINPCFSILHGTDRAACMRPNTFPLITVDPPKVSNTQKLLRGGVIEKVQPKKHFISSQSKEDSAIFCDQLNKVLQNIRAWETDFVRPYSQEEFNRIIMLKQ